MSKIYEALQKGKGEISEVLPELLETKTAVSEESSSMGAPEDVHRAVNAVLGDSAVPGDSAARRISPGADPKTPVSHAALRRAPIALSGTSPLLPFDDSNFAAAEQYRVIRTRL